MTEAVYKIRLFRNQLPITSRAKNSFVVLGNYSGMECEEITNFNELVEYRGADTQGGAGLSPEPAHPVFFINQTSEVPLFIRKKHRKDYIYALCLLSLNKATGETFILGAETTKDMIKKVRGKISRLKTKNIKTQLFPALGPADLLWVMRGRKLSDIMDAVVKIRGIRSKNKVGSPYLFVSSNVIHFVYKNYDITNALGESVKIMLSMNHIDASKNNFATACKTAFNDDADYYRSCGDWDASLSFNGISLYTAWGLLGLPLPNSSTAKNPAVKRYNAQIKVIKNQIGTNVSSWHIRYMVETEPTAGNELKIVPTGHIQKIELMKHLYGRIKSAVPLSVERTIKVLVSQCEAMLKHPYKQKNGIRMYNILMNAMTVIHQAQSSGYPLNGKTVAKCFDGIKSTLNNSLMASHFNLDHFSARDIEAITPTIKLFFAYESIIGKVFSTMDISTTPNFEQASNSIFFITVDSDTEASSTSFLGGLYYDNDRELYGINLPNIAYFDFKYVPSIIHEALHFVRTDWYASPDAKGVVRNAKRNKMLYNIICKGVIKKINDTYDKLYGKGSKVSISKSDKDIIANCSYKFATALNNRFPKDTKDTKDTKDVEDFNLRPFVYDKKMTEVLENADFETLYKEARDINEKSEEGGAEKVENPTLSNEKEPFYYISLHACFESMRKDIGELIINYQTVINEAVTDMLMCVACNIDAEKYVNYIAGIITENKMVNVKNDKMMKMRVLCVVIALYYNESNSQAAWNKDFYDNYINNIKDFAAKIAESTKREAFNALLTDEEPKEATTVTTELITESAEREAFSALLTDEEPKEAATVITDLMSNSELIRFSNSELIVYLLDIYDYAKNKRTPGTDIKKKALFDFLNIHPISGGMNFCQKIEYLYSMWYDSLTYWNQQTEPWNVYKVARLTEAEYTKHYNNEGTYHLLQPHMPHLTPDKINARLLKSINSVNTDVYGYIRVGYNKNGEFAPELFGICQTSREDDTHIFKFVCVINKDGVDVTIMLQEIIKQIRKQRDGTIIKVIAHYVKYFNNYGIKISGPDGSGMCCVESVPEMV